MDKLKHRSKVLEVLGANSVEREELLQYNQNYFARVDVPLDSFPLPDEPSVAVWEEYAREAALTGAGVQVLDRYLVQFRFPIAEGISATPEYRLATRKGIVEGLGSALSLRAPQRTRICVHETPAGRIPILIAEEREDFVALVRALSLRNEPVAVPESQGACLVGGFNNWHRVQLLRDQWTGEHPGASASEWNAAFGEMVPRRELYQDRFMILSAGPYSGVQASDMGMDEDEWRRTSLAIRREHECAHYFTLRILGSMRNNLLDELIADYCGIVAACGRYRSDWYLRFMGLECYPAFRAAGRLNNYRGAPALSDGAFAILRKLVVLAARNLEEFDRANFPRGRRSAPEMVSVLMTLTRLTMEELASARGVELLCGGHSATTVTAATGVPAGRVASL